MRPADEPRVALRRAVAGAIGGIIGLTQALHGFLMTRIEDVAGGPAVAISSRCAALVVLATIGMSLEGRSFAADPGGTPHAATRWAWYGFPVLGVLVLALTILLVMVPIERKLGQPILGVRSASSAARPPPWSVSVIRPRA